MMTKKNKDEKTVVVITGASSGIGKTTAEYFVQKGFIVYGLARRKIDLEGVTSLSCDVTDSERVSTCVEQIYRQEGKIDVLINNAGFGISGAVENQKTEDIERIFKVNFIGAVTVTQKVLPYMRKQNNGKIINTSSVASIIPIPFQSYYCATKAALDIWAKALMLEVKPYNISVCNVLVGDTKTGFTAVREKSTSDAGSVYEKTVEKSVAKMEKDERNGKDPITVSKVMFKLAQRRKMPPTKVVGGVYKLLLFLQKILPQRFMLWVVSKMYT